MNLTLLCPICHAEVQRGDLLCEACLMSDEPRPRRMEGPIIGYIRRAIKEAEDTRLARTATIQEAYASGGPRSLG